MPYSLTQAYSNAVNDKYNTYNRCLQQVREWWGVSSKYPSAISAWRNAKYKYTSSNPPKGAPVFFSGGYYGHIAFSLGNGYVRSTDVAGKGRVGTVPIGYFAKYWGYKYLGWTKDLNGVTLPIASTAATSGTVLSSVDASKASHAASTAPTSYSAGVLLIQKALAKKVGLNYSSAPGRFGPATKDAYARWQRSLGYKGDGVPGVTSLTALGRATNLFKVVP